MGNGTGRGRRRGPERRLPKGTPKEVVDFVACRSDSVVLQPGRQAGLEVMGTTPEISFAPGADGGISVTVTGAGGLLSITLGASVTASGELQVDTSNLPMGADAVNTWVREFNEALRSRGKKLGGATIENGRVRLTKVAAAGENTSATTPGGGLKKKVAVAAGAAVVAAGVGVGVATSGDGGSGERPSQAAEPAAATGLVAKDAPCEAPAGTPELDKVGAELLKILEEAESEIWKDKAKHAPCDGYDQGALNQPGGPYPGCSDPCADTFLVAPLDMRVVHTPSQPDAVTGQQGPSHVAWHAWTNAPGRWWVNFTGNCTGTPVTGQASVGPDGMASGQFPLFSYGPCEGGEAFVTPPDQSSGAGHTPFPPFEVGPNEGPAFPGLPGSDGFDPGIDWGGPADTTALLEAQATLGGALVGFPTDPRLSFFGAPPPPTANQGFNVLWGPPGSLDAPPPPPDSPFAIGATSGGLLDGGPAHGDILFGNSMFPCGPGRTAYTVCGDEAAFPEGRLLVLSAVTGSAIPLASGDDATYRFEIDAGADGSADAVWSLTRGPDGWSLDGGEGGTVARGLIRNNAVALVVAAEEVGSAPFAYRVSAIDDGGAGTAWPSEDGWAPVPDEPVTAAATGDGAPSGEAGGESDDAKAFLLEVSRAARDGDIAFLLEHLHPVVIERYGEDQCRTHAGRISDPLAEATPDRVHPPESWDYTTDGLTTTIPDAVAIDLERDVGTTRQAHVALADGTWRWFTDCGTPAQ